MISCDCGYNDGGSTCLSELFPKAKKQYECCECFGSIQPGEKYHKYTGTYEGELFSEKTCMPCYGIRRDFCCEFTFGELRFSLIECLGFDYTKLEDK